MEVLGTPILPHYKDGASKPVDVFLRILYAFPSIAFRLALMTFFALGGNPIEFPPKVMDDLLLSFRTPRILQRHDAVKREPPLLRASGIRDKVSMPEKLQSVSRFLQ